MAIRTYKVTLDSKNTIAPEPVYLRQGDKTGAVVINATLMDNGAPVSLDGLTPMFKANTADGQAVIADSTGFNVLDSANGEFTYQVPNALSSVPGKITTAYFSFSDSSGSESTFDVAFIIKAAVDISQRQAEDYITIIDGTLNSLHKQIDAMNTDIQTVLNAYNQGDFYNKAETDSKDATTLASAKNYTDSAYPHHQVLRMGTRFFAHRGALSLAPENSRPAIQKAGNHAGVEIDIHTTADGVWMVMHDGTVDRMTNGSGAISSFTYQDIRKLRFDAGNNLDKYPDEALIIPTLEEALADCKDHRLIPVIEIKVDSTDNYTKENYDDLVALINKFDLKDECMFISFDYNALVEIKKRLPLVEVSWLQSVISDNTIASAQALGVNAGIDSNYTNESVTLDNIRKVHDAGLKMGVWTLEDDSQRAKLIGMGVDYITTNSLSGERRFADLDMQNGWENYSSYHRSYVQEVGPGVVMIYFNIIDGSSAVDTKGTVFANIPSWAVPTYDLWNPCIYRDDNGTASSTFDVIDNELQVGLNWANRKSSNGWITGNVTYHV